METKSIIDFADYLGSARDACGSDRRLGHCNMDWIITAAFREDIRPYAGLPFRRLDDLAFCLSPIASCHMAWQVCYTDFMKSYQPSRSPCPIGRVARVLGDRWVLLILREVYLGAERFEDFIEPLGINRAALTSRLAMMQEAGLLERDPPEGKRARYIPTEKARALLPVYQEMAKWGGEHLFAKDEERTRWPEG